MAYTALLVAGASLSLLACTDDSPSRDDTASHDLSDDGSPLQTSCQFWYVDETCPNGTCPFAVVDQFGTTTNGTCPSFHESLGDSDPEIMPFSALVRATPVPLAGGGDSTTDAYFTLSITPNDDPSRAILSEAEVSVLSVMNGSIGAGFLRAGVLPFVYQGVTYNTVQAFCSIRPAP